jgi:hypothetical protein
MKTLIRICGLLLMLFGLGASFLSLFPLVYYIEESIAVNELSDFALKMGDLGERYKRQLREGTEFVLETVYRNTLVFIVTWLSFSLTLLIKFCGVEILFLRETGRRLIIPISFIAIFIGIIGSMFTLQMLGMLNAMIAVGARDLDKYGYLSNLAVNKVVWITVAWVLFYGFILLGSTHPKVKEHFV